MNKTSKHKSAVSAAREAAAILGFALLFAVAGCSEHAPRREDDEPTSSARLPLRLLPPSPAIDPNIVIDETFEDTADAWWVLALGDVDPDDETATYPKTVRLERVEGSELVRHENGILSLERGPATLVRFLELPPRLQHDVSIVLEAPSDMHVGDLTRQLHFCFLQELDEDDRVEEILERGYCVARPRGGKIPLKQALPLKLNYQRERPQARWQTARDLDGFARARHRIMPTPTRRLYAIFVPAIDRHVRLKSFRLTRVAAFRSRTSVTRSTEGATPTKLSGEVRPAVWVEPESNLRLAFDMPPGAHRISLAFGEDPDAPPGTETRWSVRLLDPAGTARAETEGTIRRSAADPRFHPAALEAGGSDFAPGASILAIDVEGDSGAFVAQPIVRGPTPAGPPNLLLVSLDTLRADHLPAYGYSRDTAPFLSRLAAQSALFENYLGVAPYTLPTHATMFTGRLPPRHGAVAETDRLNTRDNPYLPHILAEHGFTSAAFTGGGFLSEVFGFTDGFDLFRTIDPIEPAPDADPTSDVLDQTSGLRDVISWIRERRDERWMVFLHTFMIHDYKPPAEDFSRFDTRPDVTPGRDPFTYLRDREWFENPPSPGDVQHLVDLYDATIHFTDRALERMFEELEREGLLENAVVVVTSDHGEEFWDHGGLKHSVTLYDEMLRVPLLIRAPGIPPRRVREPVSQADLLPTILDLLSIPPPPAAKERPESGARALFDGHSKASLLRGRPEATPATPLYAQINTRLSNRASLRHGRYKVIQNHRSTFVRHVAEAAVELYDMREDPAERDDLAESLRRERDRMLEHLEATEAFLRMGAVSASNAEMTQELMQQMAELGYVGGG